MALSDFSSEDSGVILAADYAGNPAVFKSLTFLLREWRPSLNTIEFNISSFFKFLIVENTKIIKLAKIDRLINDKKLK